MKASCPCYCNCCHSSQLYLYMQKSLFFIQFKIQDFFFVEYGCATFCGVVLVDITCNHLDNVFALKVSRVSLNSSGHFFDIVSAACFQLLTALQNYVKLVCECDEYSLISFVGAHAQSNGAAEQTIADIYKLRVTKNLFGELLICLLLECINYLKGFLVNNFSFSFINLLPLRYRTNSQCRF